MELGEVTALHKSENVIEVYWTFDLKLNNVKNHNLFSPSINTFKRGDNELIKWYLLFCTDKTDLLKMPVSLTILEDGCEPNLEASFTFSLLDQNGSIIVSKRTRKVLCDGDGYGYGFQQFEKLDFIMDPENNIIKNDQLTIACAIHMDGSIVLKKNVTNFSRSTEFDDFEKLLTNSVFSDITIVVDGKSLHAHKCILASRSIVFDVMFKHDMTEKNQSVIKIEDIEAEVFSEFLRFLYTGKVNEIEKIVCKLLTAAEKYSVEGLKTLCEETMYNSLSESNALDYLCAADINRAEKVKMAIIEWISIREEKFSKKPEFKTLAKNYPELFFDVVTEKYRKQI